MKLKKNSKENDQKMKSENDHDMNFQKILEENDQNTLSIIKTGDRIIDEPRRTSNTYYDFQSSYFVYFLFYQYFFSS